MRPIKSNRTTTRLHTFEEYEQRLAMTSDILPVVMSEIAPQVAPPLSFNLEQGGELDAVNAAVSSEAPYNNEVIGAPVPVPSDGSALSTFAGNNWTDVDYARSNYGLRGNGQTVVVIDSGIAYDHQALGQGFGSGKRVVGGWDFAENDANPYDDGPSGFHGTHVAGIIGSSDATYTGIAPGVDLVSLRVFDDNGNGNFSWVESALRWVHDHKNSFANPVTTVNLSIGGGWNSNTIPPWAILEDEFAQLKADGIFISVAAGNAFTKYNTSGLSYPAASVNVVPVMSIDGTGKFSSFSQRATRGIAAPGQGIVSTVPDYLNSPNGIANDFASASGTSMAAPYIAGVSALVREAMQSYGRTGITQDMIYDHLRATADSFYDSVTKDNYLRVNVRRAMDALAGSDTFGNTAATATARGSWSGTTAITERFNSVSDKDYFSFVADRSGTMTLQATRTGSGNFSWSVVGGSTSTSNTLALNVISGQTYTVGLSNTAIGSYSITGAYSGSSNSGGGSSNSGGSSNGSGNGGGGSSGGAIGISTTNLGTVDYTALNNIAVSGSRSFSFRAANAATLIVEARQASGTGVSFDILNNAGSVLRSATVSNGVGRVDVAATQGQSFTLRITGNASGVDFKISDVFVQSNQGVTILGSSKDDVVAVNASNSTVTVNGIVMSLAGATNVSVLGGGGNDSINITGRSDGTDQATYSATGLTLLAGNTTIVTSGFEYSLLFSKAADSVRFNDSRSSDAFWIGDSHIEMVTAAGRFNAVGFGSGVVNATAGGTDSAYFKPSAGTPLVNRVAATINANNGRTSISFRGIETAFAVDGGNLNPLSTGGTDVATPTPINLPWATNAPTFAAAPTANPVATPTVITTKPKENTTPPLSAVVLEKLGQEDYQTHDAALTSALEALHGDITERFARGRNHSAPSTHAQQHDDVLANLDIADLLGH